MCIWGRIENKSTLKETGLRPRAYIMQLSALHLYLHWLHIDYSGSGAPEETTPDFQPNVRTLPNALCTHNCREEWIYTIICPEQRKRNNLTSQFLSLPHNTTDTFSAHINVLSSLLQPGTIKPWEWSRKRGKSTVLVLDQFLSIPCKDF